MNLKDEIAIITGAGSGIGEATAIELAKGGCAPVLVGRRKDKLEKVLQEVRSYAPEATAEVCGISKGLGSSRWYRERMSAMGILTLS